MRDENFGSLELELTGEVTEGPPDLPSVDVLPVEEIDVPLVELLVSLLSLGADQVGGCEKS